MDVNCDVIKGKFSVTLFRNDSNSYTVRKFKLFEEDNRMMTVTGYLPHLEEDILYRLYGVYKDHPKYGMQFVVERYERVQLDDVDALISMFSGPKFVGIGKKMARVLVETLGVDLVNRIMQDPNCLDEVDKMTPKRKEAIIQGVKDSQDPNEEIIRFFTLHGLNMRQAMKVQAVYGEDIIEKLTHNPYRMVEEVDGIGFKTADQFAHTLGFEDDNPYRVQACCVALVMEECMRTGSSYLLVDDLKRILSRELVGVSFDFAEVIGSLGHSRKLVMEEDRIYHVSQFDAECYISQYFAQFPQTKLIQPNVDELYQYIHEIEQRDGIALDQMQEEAILTFFKEDVMILTGGPGTGKTTTVKTMVELCRRLYPTASIALCAPTGRAAKRLTQLAGFDATTIHSLLRWDLETNHFGKDDEDPLIVDVLIVDEFSMVDQFLFYHLLLANINVKKIVLIGDEDQLPSVSIGNVLHDMMTSTLFPYVRLSKIFRQKEGSGIVDLAHAIHDDVCDEVPKNMDVRFISCTPYQIRDGVVQLVQHALHGGLSIQDIQVLAPRYDGVAGIHALNASLQQTINPPDQSKREIKVGYRTFREGDKILQLKNDPDQNVFNGDIGELVEIVWAKENETNRQRILVDFDGVLVEYGPETFVNITHAYCISIHKSQGSEYPLVIMPLAYEYGIMLQKRLLYTGITRAGKHLVMLGEPDAFLKGIHQNERIVRQTTLCERLHQEMERFGWYTE